MANEMERQRLEEPFTSMLWALALSRLPPGPVSAEQITTSLANCAPVMTLVLEKLSTEPALVSGQHASMTVSWEEGRFVLSWLPGRGAVLPFPRE